MTIKEKVNETYLVPVVVMDDAAKAIDAGRALLAGGVNIMEITLRTAAGLQAIENVAKSGLDLLVGAGTVLSLDKCKEAISRGAKFIVSPGYDQEIVEHCLKNNIAIYPGCVTPTEITAAIKTGLDVIKFFPAQVYGGVAAIKALAGPFPGIKFIPTGGADNSNLAQFVIPEVIAVGGGWLCDRKQINAGDFQTITSICEAARKIVVQTRK